jgi:hypothetical protein
VNFKEETPSASISKTTPEDVPVLKAARTRIWEVWDVWIKFGIYLFSTRFSNGEKVANRQIAQTIKPPKGGFDCADFKLGHSPRQRAL